MSHQQGNLIRLRIHAPLRKPVSNLVEEWPEHGGHATTNDDNVRIKQVNDIAQPRREEVDCLHQNLAGCGISRGERLTNLLARDGSNVTLCEIEHRGMTRRISRKFRPRTGSNRGPGSKYFNAACLAAAANWPPVVDAHMTAFTGRPVLAVINRAVEHNTGSDS